MYRNITDCTGCLGAEDVPWQRYTPISGSRQTKQKPDSHELTQVFEITVIHEVGILPKHILIFFPPASIVFGSSTNLTCIDLMPSRKKSLHFASTSLTKLLLRTLNTFLSLLEKCSLWTNLAKLLEDTELDSSKQMSTYASISVLTYISLHIGHLCEGIEWMTSGDVGVV